VLEQALAERSSHVIINVISFGIFKQCGSFYGTLLTLRNFLTTPEVKQDHPLNLSISVSEGKENNDDCPSSGE